MTNFIRLATLLTVSALSLCAQLSTGSIVGTVRDPSGAAIPRAAVTAVHLATSRERHTTSNEQGDFVLSSVESGACELTFTAPGFKKKVMADVNLSTGATLPVGDISLEIGAAAETVLVTAQATLVETRSSDRAGLISSSQIDRLLVRGRNFTDLLQIMPGVVTASKPQDLSSATNFNVMGNRQTSNNITIDGVPATDMGNGSQLKLTVSQDAVAEMKVEISNYQAEYGRMAGSNVIVVTKSGTREFHGLVSYFKRHEQFNANDFFSNLNGIPRQRYRYNTWTYNISGPVTIPKLFNKDRNKLFFYWGQEFWPTVTSVTGSVTVPTALERAGDFSQTVDQNNRPIVVRDPFTGNAAFPNNIIPANRLSADGLALLKLFPQPNFLNRAISGGNYNYVFSSQVNAPKQTNTGKVDYILTSNNTLTGSVNTFSDDREGSLTLPDTGSLNWPLSIKHYYTHPVSVTARWTSVIRPTMINEATFGFLTQPARDTYTADQLAKIQRTTVGFNAGQFAPSANPLGIIPNTTFGGVPGAANLVEEGRFPLYNDYQIFTGSDNLTLTLGGHTIKTGAYLERFGRNQKKAVNFNGSLDFGQNTNNPLNTGYAYANAALGVFNQYTESTGLGWMNVNSWDTEVFVQDNWKVNRRLTLDYGLRMYWINPMTESDNLISAFVPSQYSPSQAAQLVAPALVAGQRVGLDPITGKTYAAAQIGAIAPGSGTTSNGMVRAGTGGLPDSIINNRGVQWGPRIGFAYDVNGNGKTAVHGGFGVFYNRFFTETYFVNMIAQPPLVQTPIVTYGQLANLASSTGLNYPTNVYAPDLQGKLPTVMNYSLSVQREIGFKTVVDIAYAGSLGRHLVWFRDLNSIPVGTNFLASSGDATLPGRPLPTAFLRPTLGYNSIYSMEGASSSNYNSLQTTVQRRFANHLQFGLAYTWSKALDYNDTDTDVVTSLVRARSWYYGLASFDRTHMLSVNYIYEVPSTPWKNFGARTFLNGWQLSGISQFSSGAPLGVGLTTTTGADITGTPTLSARPDVAGNPVLPNDQRTFARNFDTSVFRLPATGTLGNSGRTVIRGPGVSNWDLSLAKTFPIAERLRLSFRAEAYNVFNHTQFSALDTTARFDPATGQQVNSRFGAFTAARDPRQMQFALRLTF